MKIIIIPLTKHSLLRQKPFQLNTEMCNIKIIAVKEIMCIVLSSLKIENRTVKKDVVKVYEYLMKLVQDYHEEN